MSFPCTSCGACCARVKGPYKEWLDLRPDGSCVNYDRATKECMIYETRPGMCKVDVLCPDGDYRRILEYCDQIHLSVYGSTREQEGKCVHKEPSIRLQLETVSTCNAACNFCVYKEAGRAGGLMDMELFHKIVDEAATIRYIDTYSLQGLGEPVLDRFLVERVKYIREKDPEASIELYTNGVAMTPSKFMELRDSGLNCVVVSVNAIDGDQHKAVMGLDGKFDKVVANCEYAIAHRKDMTVQIHAVEDAFHFTIEDSEKLYEKWGHWEHGGHGKAVGIGNWAGDIDGRGAALDTSKCCFRALTTIYVMYDGRVTMCCFDPTGKTIFGDLNKQTLREVYSDENYVRFREDHANDRADKWEQCKGCSRI